MLVRRDEIHREITERKLPKNALVTEVTEWLGTRVINFDAALSDQIRFSGFLGPDLVQSIANQGESSFHFHKCVLVLH